LSLAFVYGEYVDLLPDHPHLFVYIRALESERFLVALNFSRDPVTLPALDIVFTRVVLSNAAPAAPFAELASWEARILSA
jgi:oligo-1,6-glucosidase